jgi:phosphatidylserine/phosphatidylglycerophosphate/cardiolipin synthase-like enzyme
VIEALPLHPGGDPLAMARRIEAFLREARESLDLALYDVRLPGEPGDVVANALCAAAERGVRVRIAYNADHPERVFFPPPPRTKPELLEALPFPTCGIPGIPDLMHHKYVVRDRRSVWTGSMNWTTDSWTLQENVIVTASESPELAAEYAQNFEELWSSRDVDASGHQNPERLEVGGHEVRAWFTPGHGEELSHRIGQAIACARRRVRIASPVITAGSARSPRSRRSGAWTCGGWWTARRWSRSSTSGARTATRPGRSRSSGRCCRTRTSRESARRSTRRRRPTTSCTRR